MNKEQLKKARDARRLQMHAECLIDAGNPFNVCEEALDHLIDNYEAKKSKHDYCLLLYGGVIGKSRAESGDMKMDATFAHGDFHEMSHGLAELMDDDADFCRMVFHAVEVYARKKAK